MAFLSLITESVLCQAKYLKILYSPLNESSIASVETEIGEIIILTEINSYLLTNDYILILKINMLGDTIASRKVKRTEDVYTFNKILYLGNNKFVALGGAFDYGSNYYTSINNKVIQFTFDSNLDSISTVEISISVNPIPLLSQRDAIINHNNHIVSLLEDMSGKNIMILETTTEGDSIAFNKIVPESSSQIYAIMEQPDFIGYYITSYGYFNDLTGQSNENIISIDNDLNYLHQDSLPGRCSYMSQMEKSSNNILVGGRAQRLWTNYPPYITEEYCIEKLDSTLQTTNQIFLSHVYQNHSQDPENDTISYPALSQNFDFIDTNNIYTCHYREYPSAIYPTRQNYFVVAKFDSNLELKWQYYFGNDAYYAPNHILATSDGGCFVTGNRYDYLTQNQEFDIFYLKLDSTGIFTSSGESNMAIHSALVFPNPGNDILYLESGPQVLGSYFQLYDLQGIKMHELKITASQQHVNTLNMPLGMYIWRIVNRGKIVDSGKWIKAER